MNFIGQYGRLFYSFTSYLGGIFFLLCSTFYWTCIAPFSLRKPIRIHATFEQMVRIGVKSVPIVSLVLFFVGMILAMQMAYVLRAMNMMTYVPQITALAVVRELGPMLAAIVMSGRIGASIAAELGTMKVSEEILALETSALPPVHFLVVPRVLASIIMLPCLTIIANILGILGGYVVTVPLMQAVDGHLYYAITMSSMIPSDIITGLGKSVVFAIIVSLIACYEGFKVSGGAEGVGKATTSAVVLSIVGIISSDCAITALLTVKGL